MQPRAAPEIGQPEGCTSVLAVVQNLQSDGCTALAWSSMTGQGNTVKNGIACLISLQGLPLCTCMCSVQTLSLVWRLGGLVVLCGLVYLPTWEMPVTVCALF